MGLHDTLRFIWRHPLSRGRRVRNTVRFFVVQARLLSTRAPQTFRFVNGLRLTSVSGQYGVTGNLYVGLHEFEEMCFVAHGARPDDLFVDLGANVGTYSVIAAGIAGARCIAVEPNEAAIDSLQRNLAINSLAGIVEIHQMGVGAQSLFRCHTRRFT